MVASWHLLVHRIRRKQLKQFSSMHLDCHSQPPSCTQSGQSKISVSWDFLIILIHSVLSLFILVYSQYCLLFALTYNWMQFLSRKASFSQYPIFAVPFFFSWLLMLLLLLLPPVPEAWSERIQTSWEDECSGVECLHKQLIHVCSWNSVFSVQVSFR